jgi:hypothetical protein
MAEERTPQLDVRELYGRRQAKDTARLRAYNQILDSIHHRVRTISQMPMSPCEVLYPIPPFILGLPRIDLEDCVVYLVHQLRTAGFEVRFTYPNLLHISWLHHERGYILEQSPIMQAMLETSEAATARQKASVTFSRRVRKARAPATSSHSSLFAAPRSTAPMASAGYTVDMSAPSVGRALSASDYLPPTTFLQTMERPPPRPGMGIPNPVVVPMSVGGRPAARANAGAGAGAGSTGDVLADLWR